MYAPVAHVPSAFHRAVFIFVSPQARPLLHPLWCYLTFFLQGDQLHAPGAVRALRAQLPRTNSFYAYDPAGVFHARCREDT